MRSHAPIPVALIGISGAGKSALAPLLASRLDGASEDLDARLEGETGLSVRAIFERDGETGFRRLEERALLAALASGASVIACGGGVVETDAARRLLRSRTYAVWLEVSPEQAARRVEPTQAEHPLLVGGVAAERLAAMLGRRAPWFAEIAAMRVRVGPRSPGELAEAIARALEARAADRGEP